MRAADSRSPLTAVAAASPRSDSADVDAHAVPEGALEALDEERDRVVVAALVERQDAEIEERPSRRPRRSRALEHRTRLSSSRCARASVVSALQCATVPRSRAAICKPLGSPSSRNIAAACSYSESASSRSPRDSAMQPAADARPRRRGLRLCGRQPAPAAQAPSARSGPAAATRTTPRAMPGSRLETTAAGRRPAAAASSDQRAPSRRWLRSRPERQQAVDEPNERLPVVACEKLSQGGAEVVVVALEQEQVDVAPAASRARSARRPRGSAARAGA